jgi:predicted RNase H-like HicB family nuclease
MESPYPLIIEWSDEDNRYVVTSPTFPGFSALGETREQALVEGQIALSLFIESYNDRGIPLPEWQGAQHYSGQTRLRLSKSLHRQSAAMAESEGVSLNQYIVDALTSRVARDQVATPIIEEMRRQFDRTHVAIASAIQVQQTRYTETETLRQTERTVSIVTTDPEIINKGH